MRYFFHIKRGDERVEDPEGAEFADIYAAVEEAEATAREIAAEELLDTTLPANWCLEVADIYGRIHDVVPFGTLVARPQDLSQPDVALLKNSILGYYEGTRCLVAESNRLASTLKVTCLEIRQRLAALDRIESRQKA